MSANTEVGLSCVPKVTPLIESSEIVLPGPSGAPVEGPPPYTSPEDSCIYLRYALGA